MKNLIPGKVELAVLFVVALVCTAVVAVSPVFDLAMAVSAVPLFMTGSILGLRKNAKIAALRRAAVSAPRKMAEVAK